MSKKPPQAEYTFTVFGDRLAISDDAYQALKPHLKAFLEPAPDAVNHPEHYTSHPAKCECGKPVECIQVTEHMLFNLGNAVKYIWRADLKGDAIQDLEKAAWYVRREIERRKRSKSTLDILRERLAEQRAKEGV